MLLAAAAPQDNLYKATNPTLLALHTIGVIDIDGRITADFADTLRGNIFFKSNNILCCYSTPSCRT